MLSPIGQEFTPTLDNIAAIDLPINLGWAHPRGSNGPITVSVRDGTITGNILGAASATPKLPYTVANLWVRFDFTEAIPLVPGNLYVIQASAGSPSEFVNWGWIGWYPVQPDEIPGRPIANGNVSQGPYPTPFGFRTYAVPEPALAMLLAFGGLTLLRRRRCGHRFSQKVTAK